MSADATPPPVPAPGRVDRNFDELVLDRTGPEFVERRWLRDEVEQALASERGQYVLVIGEPGAGKTSLLAGMARAHPEWLRYFVRRDSRTSLTGGDVQSFLLSVGHQLARLWPGIFQPERLAVVVRQHIEAVQAGGRAVGVRIDDLKVSPFHRTAILEIEQRVTEAAGPVTGLEIGAATLDPRLLEPDTLAHLALIDPAEVLLGDDPQARIVILVDALDELARSPGTGSLLDWLAHGPELPPNVRLVMAARPHSALGALRAARADQLTEVAIDPRSQQVTDDLLAYAQLVLGGEAVAHAVEANGLFLDQFQRDAVRRADGNFLHLSTYSRALNDAVGRADGGLVAQLIGLDGLPPGLEGLYAFFVETARADLVRLGMLEVRDPLTSADALTPAWEGAAQPILGVLTVARGSLTVEELAELGGIRVAPRAVRNVLARLRWLLDVRDDRVAFFHASIGEFLASERALRDHPDWAVDESEWHERIVRHYRGGSQSWAAVDWGAVDSYGLVHLVEHVVASRACIADEVADLVCPGLRRAIRTRFGSDRHFLRIIELAADRALSAFPLATGLPTVLYLAVVRRQVRRSSRSLAPAVLGLLARMGRTGEALEHVAALPPSRQQFEAVREILNQAAPGDGDPDQHRKLLDLLVETALTIPESQDRAKSLRQAAQHLAPDDLRRALRLWERAQAFAPDRDDAPDAVYQAALSSMDSTEARTLIASMRNGRASAYLDLATRVQPGEVPDLLRQAEASLGAEQAERLRCLARLAAAWAPVEPSQSQRYIAAVMAETTREPDTEAELTRGLVEAARELAKVDRITAHHLLDRLEAVPINGRAADEALMHAAELWVAWGSPDKARRLLDGLISGNNNSEWWKVRAATVLRPVDAAAAQQLVEEAYAGIPPAAPAHSFLGQLGRDFDLQTVALALAEYDLCRAAAVAREIQNTTWQSEVPRDRYTALARVAHRHLDAGNVPQAELLLDEALRFAESAPPLVDARKGEPFRRATGAPEGERGPRAEQQIDLFESLPFVMNHIRDWGWLAERRFYLDPADVIRAMAPGPWSIGNPYTWARTVRAFAEAIADRELPRAIQLVRSLTDRGERAVGLAAMFRAAWAGPDRDVARRLWEEFNTALDAVERFEWVHVHLDEQDRHAFAYVRPDHRARFEAAIRLIPAEADAGRALLAQSGATYLTYAVDLAFGVRASAAYASSVIRGERPFPLFQLLHESLLEPRAPSKSQDEFLINIARAGAASNERRIAATGQARAAGRPRIEDPLYDAWVDLMMPTRGGPGGAAFEKLRALLDGPRLPAVAALAALAAQTATAGGEQMRNLCADIVAAAQNREPAARVVTLLPFAVSPAGTGLVDPRELLAETTRLGYGVFERVERDEVLVGLFPTLLILHPADALRLLYDAVEESWSRGMAFLERGAETLVGALGTGVVSVLNDAIVRALECTASEGGATVIDGVTVPSTSLTAPARSRFAPSSTLFSRLISSVRAWASAFR